MQQIICNARAELLMPLLIDGWTDYSVRMSGQFYKEYSPDLLSVDSTTKTVELSRDGLFQILPEAMFFNEDFLREDNEDVLKQKLDYLKYQKELLKVYFEAFDTLIFQNELYFYQVLESAECERDNILLSEFYNIDITKEMNPLCRQLARLLLDGDTIKGDLRIVAFCIRAILHVDLTYDVISHIVDNSKYTLVQYILFIDGLSSRDYKQRMENYYEFFNRLEQWFLPYDCEADFCIKGRNQPFILGEPLTLDYNTRLETA